MLNAYCESMAINLNVLFVCLQTNDHSIHEVLLLPLRGYIVPKITTTCLNERSQPYVCSFNLGGTGQKLNQGVWHFCRNAVNPLGDLRF